MANLNYLTQPLNFWENVCWGNVVGKTLFYQFWYKIVGENLVAPHLK